MRNSRPTKFPTDGSPDTDRQGLDRGALRELIPDWLLIFRMLLWRHGLCLGRPRPEDDDIWKFEIQTVAYVEIRGYFPFGDDRRPSHQDDRQVKKTSVAGRCWFKQLHQQVIGTGGCRERDGRFTEGVKIKLSITDIYGGSSSRVWLHFNHLWWSSIKSFIAQASHTSQPIFFSVTKQSLLGSNLCALKISFAYSSSSSSWSSSPSSSVFGASSTR